MNVRKYVCTKTQCMRAHAHVHMLDVSILFNAACCSLHCVRMAPVLPSLTSKKQGAVSHGTRLWLMLPR